MLQKPLKAHGAKPFDGLLIGLILQARECRLRGQRIGFTNDGLKRRIIAQCVGVVAILVACSDLIDSLAEHLMGMVLDENRITPVVAKPVESFCECQLSIELAQEQKTGVAGNLTAVKIENNFGLKT